MMSHSEQLHRETYNQPCDQPCREANLDAIEAFIVGGCKPSGGNVGIELEHILVSCQDHHAAGYYDEGGARWALERLLDEYPQDIRTNAGDLIGAERPHESITLEPGGQLEFSAGPFSSLSEAKRCFDAFEALLGETLAPAGTCALTVGFHPTSRAADLPLIPKPRYAFMNRYFNEIGPWGIRMMRGSASTQVSIDFESPADAARKLRLANAAVPLLALIADNTPVFEAEPSPHAMMRTEMWNGVDPDRCGVVPGSMSPSFTVRDYAAYILDTPAIVAPDLAQRKADIGISVKPSAEVPGCTCNSDDCATEASAADSYASSTDVPNVSTANGSPEFIYDERTFGEIFADQVMSESDVQHALSMVFPDVRIKRILEIRPADSLPVDKAIAYAALVKGLFTAPASLDALDKLFAGVTEADIAAAKASLMQNGWDSEIYGKTARELREALFNIAAERLGKEARFLAPLR